MPDHSQPLRYCLDASISYKVARALRDVGHDFVHVSEVEELLAGDEAAVGHCGSPDETIAQWCAQDGRILVAIDDDHAGRSTRGYALREIGVEVILFTKDIKSLPEQHRQVTEHLPGWSSTIGREPREPRLWIQHPNRKHPDLGDGKKRKRRKRQSSRRRD